MTSIQIAALIIAVFSAAYFYLISGKPKVKKEGNRYVVTALPSTMYVFWLAIKKSLFSKKSRSTQLPEISFVMNGIEIEGAHVKKYRKLCGFSENDAEVPISYPYLTIFPLQTLLLVDKAFQFPAMGLVHLANRIQHFGAITTSEKVNASVKFDSKLLPHAKGYCFNVISEVFQASNNKLLWRCESTYLYRTKVSNTVDTTEIYDSKIKNEDVEGCQEVKAIKLPAGFGMKYANVSGDFNPIHIHPITAKLFGFPHGAIMHGMYNIGTCVADLMPSVKNITPSTDGNPTAEIYVELKMPMYLPANAILTSKTESINKVKDNRTFQILMKNKKDNEMVPHLRGTCYWK